MTPRLNLERLLLSSRSAEQRRVAIVKYDPAFAEFQRQHDPLLLALRRLERSRKSAPPRLRGELT